MPIYVYEPTLLSADELFSDCCYFETLQKHSEGVLTNCPTCHHAVHRALTSFAFSSTSPTQSTLSAKLKDALKSPAPKDGSNTPAASAPDTSGGRAARMAMRHICSTGCAH